MRRLLSIALALFVAHTASAQRAEPLAFHSAARVSVKTDSSVITNAPPAYAFPIRVVLGTGAAVAGGYYGILGGSILPHSDCSCDDPGLVNAVLGGAIGTIVGSAIVAAIPKFESKCGLGQRVGTALLTSTAGAVLGGFAGSLAGGEGVLVGYVGGSGLGSALGASMCGK